LLNASLPSVVIQNGVAPGEEMLPFAKEVEGGSKAPDVSCGSVVLLTMP